MKVIQPNCRVQFTSDDIDFIVQILGAKGPEFLVKLLTDPDARDSILDDESLYRAVMEHRGCLRISNHFYFYIVVRQVLRHAGIEDRAVADYVAEMLAEFSHAENVRCRIPGHAQPLDYFFEMMAALQTADERTSFYIRAHIGNHSLFLSGVFPERIRFRAEQKGFPDLKYYEEIGRANYRVARDHRLAKRFNLSSVFDVLSERFEPTRRALNDLTERIFSLGENSQAIHGVLQKNLG